MVRELTFFRSPQFFDNKFHGLSYIPAYDELIQMMADKAKTPLEEMELRQEQSNQIQLEKNMESLIIEDEQI